MLVLSSSSEVVRLGWRKRRMIQKMIEKMIEKMIRKMIEKMIRKMIERMALGTNTPKTKKGWLLESVC
jgi:carbon monoxide dehydrogenase subunit G